MKRRDFLRTVTGGMAFAAMGGNAWSSPQLERPNIPRLERPNIILFLVDDMGWQDTSLPFWNEPTPFNRHFRTPNMERLAGQGIRFTSAYAHAVCSPTRTSIMTGQSPLRHHVTNWTLYKDRDQSGGWGRLGSPSSWRTDGVQPTDVTLPRLLQQAGYFTIHCGKAHWGANGTPGCDPCALGFDVNIAGHAAGGPGSYQGLANFGNKEKGARTMPWGVPGLEKYHGEDVHLTDVLTHEAGEAVEQAVATGRPFYLYMAHYAVHAPIQPHKQHMANYEGRNYADTEIDIPPAEEKYASMVEGMDASLGALLDLVEKLGAAENTVVIFTSDNGGLSVHARGQTPRGTGADTHNWPLKAGKGSAYEGGTRVPFIAAWAAPRAGHPLQERLPLRAGAASEQPVISEDLFPTILSIAGAGDRIPADHPVDGRDVTPYLLQSDSDPGRPLRFHYPHVWGPRGPGYEPHSAMRLGDWKAIYFYNPRRWELYNVNHDIGEHNDLAAAHPERLQELAERMRRDFIAMGAQWPLDRGTGKEEPLLTPAELRQTGTIKLEAELLPPAALVALEEQKASAHVLADPDWHTWGCSVIAGEDGRFHMFYARWPRKRGFQAWLTHCEIAHAVADRPEGPYCYKETAVKARGSGHWDQFTAHNPKIKRFGDMYYLYYISTNGRIEESELDETARVGYGHANWKPLRTNQRTGVAVSDSLDGPWQRRDRPIVEPSGPITTLTVNPAVTRGPDGTYFMIVKGDKPGTTRFVRNQALATAPAPDGPFTIQPRPVIDTFDTEDVSMWYDRVRGRFYAVYHAHTHIGLISSRDGYVWRKDGKGVVMQKGLPLGDGIAWLPQRQERPFVLTDENGSPTMLYVAVKKGDLTANVALRLRVDG